MACPSFLHLSLCISFHFRSLSPLGLKLLRLSVVNFAFLLWVDTIYGRPRNFQVSLLFFTIFLESTLTIRPAIYGDHDR